MKQKNLYLIKRNLHPKKTLTPKKSTGSSSSANGSNGSSGGSTYVGAAGSYTPKIRIPRTGVTCTIFYDMTIRNMEKGVVILSTDNGLNEPGNTVISGHNRHNSRLFSKNMRLQAGDIIYITDESGQEVAYSVFSKFLTDPNDASYMERDTDGGRQISLTTCTDDNEARLVILADEI